MTKKVENFPTFLGYYHKYNCLKFRIAYALFLLRKPQDTTQIATFLGEPQNKISNAMCRYKSKGIPYFKRVQKYRGASHYNANWRLTRSGVNFLANCIVNMKSGDDLNFKRNPWKVQVKDFRVLHALEDNKITFTKEQYSKIFGISRQGYEELGLELENVLDKVPTVIIDGREVCM